MKKVRFIVETPTKIRIVVRDIIESTDQDIVIIKEKHGKHVEKLREKLDELDQMGIDTTILRNYLRRRVRHAHTKRGMRRA